MAIYKTGRSWTLTIAGSHTGTSHAKVQALPYPQIGTHAHGSNVDVRALCYSRDTYLVRWYNVINGDMSAPGMTHELYLAIDTGDGSPAGDYDTHTYPHTIITLGKENSFPEGGPFSVTVPVVECMEIYVPDGADEDGFPARPYIDADGWFAGDFLEAYKDGLPSRGVRYFMLAEAGSAIDVSVTMGDLTCSASKVLTSNMEIMDGFWPILKASWQNENQDAHTDWTVDGVAPEHDSGSLTSSLLEGTVQFSPGQVRVHYTGTNKEGVGYCDMLFFSNTKYDLSARIRNIGSASADACTVRVLDKRRRFAANDWRPSAIDIAATPDASLAITQRYHDGAIWITIPAGAIQNGPVVYQALERQPIRLWIHPDSMTDDSRDWRLQMQHWPWDALEVTQDATEAVAADTTLTHTTASVALTQGIWEGYRYLTFDTVSNFDARDITLTVGHKTFTFNTGTNGATVPQKIDLCMPANLPTDFVKDTRDSRYPLHGPATPTTEPPETDPAEVSVEERGWLFGILEHLTTIGFTALATGETLALTNIRLARDATNEAAILPSFDPDDILRGWTSETDNTYLSPLLWLYSDHKQAAVWPARAHVVPLDGVPYYVYWSISSMAGFVNYLPGWHGTVQTALTYPSLYADPTTKLISGALEVYNIPAIHWSGTAWTDQMPRAPAVTFKSALLVDEVSVQPARGNAWEALNHTSNRITDAYASKVVRAQAEGLAPVDGHVDFLRESDLAVMGTATAGTDGNYRTGTPYGVGNVNHRTQADAPTHPHEGPFKAHNRYRHRTSFYIVIQKLTTLALATHEDGRIFYAGFKDDGVNVNIGYAEPVRPALFDPLNDIGLPAVRASLAVGAGIHAPLWIGRIADDGTTDLRRTTDLGDNWLTVISLPTATDIAVCRAPDGTVIVFTLEGTAIKGRSYDPEGNALEAAWDTGVTADSAAAIDAAVFPRGGNSYAIDLGITDPASIVTSVDGGKSFS